MSYFLLFILFAALLWPLWRRWLFRFMQRRAEDYLRRSMGMPSRKEEQRARRKASRPASRPDDTSGFAFRARRRGEPGPFDAPERIVPPEYAEDVKFTEYRDFGTGPVSSGRKVEFRCESQVEDVDFVEIRP